MKVFRPRLQVRASCQSGRRALVCEVVRWYPKGLTGAAGLMMALLTHPLLARPVGPWPGQHSARAHGLSRHPLPRGPRDGCTQTRWPSRATSRDSSAAWGLQGPGEVRGGSAPRRLCACPAGAEALWPGVGQTQCLHSEGRAMRERPALPPGTALWAPAPWDSPQG